MSACKACGAAIKWARTTNDKSIPVDAEPNPDGNVVLQGGGFSAPTATVLGPLDKLSMPEGTTFHMPHHATCENWPKGGGK